MLAGIDWLVEQDVDVISMSLGGLTLDNETPNTYTEAIVTCLRDGIPVVTAIGNDGGQTTGSPGNDIFAFAVGATDIRDRAAGFSGGRTHIIRESNFIPEDLLPLPYSKPEVSAPGVAILSSVPGGKWEAFNGSSMATPHVAGAIALLLCSAPPDHARRCPRKSSGPSCCRTCSAAPPRNSASRARITALASGALTCYGRSASRRRKDFDSESPEHNPHL